VTLSARLGGFVTLAAVVVIGADGKLPSEARIFKAGINNTEKGPYLFDNESCRMVLEHQAAHGVDRMIDLEHLSLDDESPNYDPDARGWCRIDARPALEPQQDADFDLWVTGLTWNPDGAERLTSRKQRYLSPAFPVDEERRITKIVNIALTAIPATHDAPALVAANARGRHNMDPKFIALAARFGNLKKLADDAGAGEGAKGKAAAVAEAAQAAQDALEAYMKASKGIDIDATFAALDAAKAAVDAFENAANALTGAPPDADAPAAEPASAPAPDETTKTMHALSAVTGKASGTEAIAEVKRLRAVALEHETELKRLAEERKVLEAGKRRQLVGELVVCGLLTPGQAWADESATQPKGSWARLSIAELEDLVKERGGSVSVPRNVTPASASPVTQTNGINVSEFEINRLRAVYDRENKHSPTAARRRIESCIEELARTKGRQVRFAAEKGSRHEAERLSRGIRECEVLTNASGQDLVTLASVQQLPIQMFGASSQRSLEEFRLEFNSTLVSQPIPWSEDLGVVLPGGGLKDTYPLAFYAIKYREILAQNPNAVTPNSVDVSVVKRPFGAAAQANLRRLTQAGPDGRGDFAYIQTWQQNAAQMARARVNLRNHLITDLLESSSVGGGLATWGVTPDRPAGVDGANFFSASHKVNPFDPKMKLHGSATWSNLSAAGGTALPLNANNLTAAKALMLSVAGPDGEEMGTSATGILVPTALKEASRLLLTVQDLILNAGTVNGVANAFGQVKNEHYMSGFEYVWGPQLAGSGATANYYLFSRETISRGLPPWVLAEDAAEEVRVWDESSDFYKDSGEIKIGSYLMCAGALLYPHGIRMIYGA
jgi:phage I-like protein